MLRRAFRSLLNLDDPPERTALAFAIGTFIAFSPVLGLHTILAVVIAVVWRLNKVALFAGVYVTNPWTLAPIIAASWAIGKWFVASPPIELPDFTFGALMTAIFWEQITAQWRQLLPFAVGATILSIVCSLVSYPLMLYVLRSYRRKNSKGSVALVAAPIKKSIT
ncbi:MAG: DUF2062 domain-containing protein [Acidobacteriota bacterium]